MADNHILNGIIHENSLQKQRREEEEEKSEEIELTLGLSLNGKFGMDPIRTKKLKRSCSAISTIEETTRFESEPAPWWWVGDALGRTCSLPVEVEVAVEESIKRKDLQTLRRREAKRRLSEKQRSFGGAEGKVEEREENLAHIVSQRSSGSSGLSEVDSQSTPPHHGMNRTTEAKSPQSVQSFSEQKEHRPETANREAKPPRSISATNEMVKNALADMPCVSTKGDGPNGKRIEGFLYQYKKGEEVRIVCVCHGSFLTPAEFIKHAGGGDVEHPLRHIVVNPSPSL